MTIFEENAIRSILTTIGLVVGEIELDCDEYIADVNIEVNAVGLYSTTEIENISKKIHELESSLVSKGFIHDIKFGDLSMGRWRILIHFLNEEEIEEWEKEVLKWTK